MAKDWSREVAAVAPYLTGASASIIGSTPVQIPGVSQSVEANVVGMSSLPEQAYDCIVSVAGINTLGDIVSGIRACRRGLKTGGRLVLVMPDVTEQGTSTGNSYSAQCMVNLILLVGGFQVTTVEEVVTGESYIIVAERSVIAEVRAPFGVHGPQITKQVLADESIRAEYYFQVGTMMLQTGDAGLAVPCFENVLRIEPGNAEACFGLGMTYGTQGRWADAIQQFERSLQISPDNSEVQRWLTLAQQQIQAGQTAAAPAAGQNINIPRTAPSPASSRTSSQTPTTGSQPVTTAGAGGGHVQTPAGQPAGTQVPVSGT